MKDGRQAERRLEERKGNQTSGPTIEEYRLSAAEGFWGRGKLVEIGTQEKGGQHGERRLCVAVEPPRERKLSGDARLHKETRKRYRVDGIEEQDGKEHLGTCSACHTRLF